MCLYRRMQKLSWSQALHSGDAQGYSTVGEPPPAGRYLSLPPHTFSSEADEDLLISPYASYTSLTERAPPVISSWLDKLSPQGCVGWTPNMDGWMCVCDGVSISDVCVCDGVSISSSCFRNYVFQKRFVKFDGRNLMYFGSEKVRRSAAL